MKGADLVLGATVFLVIFLPLVLFATGAGIRHGLGTPVVINEILVVPAERGAPWVELYNSIDRPVSLKDWRIASTTRELVTLDGTIDPHSFRVVRVPPGSWRPEGDAAMLRGPAGADVDAIGWGALGTTGLPLATDQQVRPGVALVRNPQGFDSNSAQDFVEAPPTPGGPSPASLSPALYRVLFDATNYVSLSAGFLLWGALVLIGLVARRFELLTGERTFWTIMMAEPIGIVIYNVIQAHAFFQRGIMTTCRTPAGGWTLQFAQCEQGWAFTALFASAVAMVYIVSRFHAIARRLLEV